LIGATRAERRPQVSAFGTLGALPVFGRDAGTGLITGSGFGGSVGLALTLPVWDGGVFRARLARAQLVAEQARDTEVVVRRQARLSWQIAEAQRRHLYQQVVAWARNVPDARDAYLQTESMYAGGTATALEVLDAYAAWVSASSAYADALLRYRQSEANSIRWGTP
jgi:outer membrane protein TolC